MLYILPALIAALLIYSLIKRVDIYSAFTQGAYDALPMLVKILPCMAAMMVSINALRASGALEAFIKLISPILDKIGFPAELAPMFVLRPFQAPPRCRCFKTFL